MNNTTGTERSFSEIGHAAHAIDYAIGLHWVKKEEEVVTA